MFLDFQQKRRINSIIYSKVSILILLIIFLYSIYATFLVYKKKSDSRKELGKIEKEYNDLRLKDSSVSNQIESLKTDIGMEKEIRQKFGVAREDETLVMIVDDKKANQVQSDDDLSIWQKIKRLLNR